MEFLAPCARCGFDTNHTTEYHTAEGKHGKKVKNSGNLLRVGFLVRCLQCRGLYIFSLGHWYGIGEGVKRVVSLRTI